MTIEIWNISQIQECIPLSRDVWKLLNEREIQFEKKNVNEPTNYPKMYAKMHCRLQASQEHHKMCQAECIVLDCVCTLYIDDGPKQQHTASAQQWFMFWFRHMQKCLCVLSAELIIANVSIMLCAIAFATAATAEILVYRHFASIVPKNVQQFWRRCVYLTLTLTYDFCSAT